MSHPPDETGQDLAAVERLNAAYRSIRAQMAQVVVGQDKVLEEMLICIFARGHAILEGVPGLAKTLMVSTLARCLSLSFSRIQFTPDLMPSDITGTEIIQEDRAAGRREFVYRRGPVFANIVLADEINRTPPKTQAALLEAMQERQVTAAGQRHALPAPFFVLATQNPIEQEGTYPLPELGGGVRNHAAGQPRLGAADSARPERRRDTVAPARREAGAGGRARRAIRHEARAHDAGGRG
jgi:MoxR-like ATPase